MIKKNVGVLLPISALPGNHGIGDFSIFAYQFIDWLKEHHYRYWQILPLNPVGPGNSPYMTLCSEAIDIRYICLQDLVDEGGVRREGVRRCLDARYLRAGRGERRPREQVLRNEGGAIPPGGEAVLRRPWRAAGDAGRQGDGRGELARGVARVGGRLPVHDASFCRCAAALRRPLPPRGDAPHEVPCRVQARLRQASVRRIAELAGDEGGGRGAA